MFDTALPVPAEPATFLPAGAVVLRRGDAATHFVHVLQGRVVSGVMANGHMVHQLGTVDGPVWLESAAGLLGLTHAVDAVAETQISLNFFPVPEFLGQVQAMSNTAQNLLMDMARSQRQQTEMAVSRLSKDADARCAEWLLRHAEPAGHSGGLAVRLTERKRTIAAQLGIAPETFSRVLRHLRERHLIVGGGRLLALPDPQGLRELAGN